MAGFEIRTSNSKKVTWLLYKQHYLNVSGLHLYYFLSLQGKGLFATKKFDKGDIILEEDPLVSCQFAWNAAYRYLACDYCMRLDSFLLLIAHLLHKLHSKNVSYFSRPLETPEQNVRRLSCKPDIVLPHANCFDINLENVATCDQCGILYCGEECRQQAFDTYHRSLCYDTTDAQHPIMVLLETWK